MSGHDVLLTARKRLDRAGTPSSGAVARPGVAAPVRARSIALRVASVLTAGGLFTVSWDRLLNVQVASYNVKVPSLVFSAAFVIALCAAQGRRDALVGNGARRVVAGLAMAIVLYEGVRAVFTPQPGAAAAQLAAMLTGALLPAATLLLLVRSRGELRRALRWFLAGAVVASLFGLYQLFAFYAGWPQGISYTGVGIGTGLGRISAFNYEPAYFAYFVVLALGAYVALRRLDGLEVSWKALIAFAAVLYLANVRAVPLVVLALGVLLLPVVRSNRRLLLRGAVVAVVTAGVALAIPIAVVAASQAGADAARSSSTAGEHTHAPAPAKQLQSQLGTTVNPDEPSSNGPRLDLYRAVLAQVERSPVTGIGPGQLASALRRDAAGTVQDQGGGQVVANNIWLQALADGGVPLLLLELALVVVVAVAAFRRRATEVYPMAAAWLAVLLVGGMLTSYLFDIKIWVVLALLLVGFGVVDRDADDAKEVAQ